MDGCEMANGVQNIRFVPSGRGWSRPGIVFTAASVTLLAAFLVALPAKILDILWICSFCLAVATTIICILAKSSSDLAGFVPLIFGLTLLRLAAQAGTARSIIQDEPAGVLLGWTGSALAVSWPLGAVLVCLLLSLVFVFVVFTSCQRITLASIGYLRRILPLKRMGIETDLRLGIIDDVQAGALARRVVSESRFFADMNGTGLLMRAESAICMFILLACLVLPAMSGAVHQAAGTNLLMGTAPLVAALSLFTLIPATVVAASCGVLMNKDTLALKSDEQNASSATGQTKKITVVALDSETEGNSGQPNPDDTRSEGPAEFEPQVFPASRASLPVPMDISCRNANEYYEKLSRLICTIDAQPRVILLASDKVHSLPVTVAVNIAIRLAQKRQKVLLVDTDLERNAVAQVFDLDPDTIQKKIKPSSLENLSVCSVSAEKLKIFLRKTETLNHFGVTLIYAPNITRLGAKDEYPAHPGAFYFVDEYKPNTGQTAAEKLDFCSWLCLVPSIQSVLETKS
jgi:hypothetical protein